MIKTLSDLTLSSRFIVKEGLGNKFRKLVLDSITKKFWVYSESCLNVSLMNANTPVKPIIVIANS